MKRVRRQSVLKEKHIEGKVVDADEEQEILSVHFIVEVILQLL